MRATARWSAWRRWPVWGTLRRAALVRLSGGQQVVVDTMATAALTGVLVDVVVVLDKQHADVDMAGRLAAAAGIVAGCGALAILVLARLNRADVRPTGVQSGERHGHLLPCARRRRNLGESRSEGCGVIFQLQ